MRLRFQLVRIALILTVTSIASAGCRSQPEPPPPADPDAQWRVTGVSLRGEVGQNIPVACTAGGRAHSVWGHGVYTGDSSVCTAAVHAGLITFARGGTVTMELRPGQSIYGSSAGHGVTTGAYGEWHSSFVFPSDPAATGGTADVTPITWPVSAVILKDEPGRTHTFECPAEGTENAIYGTDNYTADSSICTAAVHVGRIDLQKGGRVMIELRPGEQSYTATPRNGITSRSYGPWTRGYVLK